MKILFVQLSDLHCKENFACGKTKIKKVVDAVSALGSVDKIFLILSGDLTDTGSIQEFKEVKKLIGKLLSDLGKKTGSYIDSIIAPGNHDIELTNTDRDTAIIATWKNKNKHIEEELKKMKNFFDYANSKKCFMENKLCHSGSIDVKGHNVQYNILNSAIFSTKELGDKEHHYFPNNIAEELIRKEEATIKFSVIHHSFEWFDWKSREMLKNGTKADDMVFIGHDHIAEISTITNDKGSTNIIMGGEFNLDLEESASFNAILCDVDLMEYEVYQFHWDSKEQIFNKKNCRAIKKYSSLLRPSDEYIRKLTKDNKEISELFTDYYVFPKLKADKSFVKDNVEEKSIKIDDIFDTLGEKEIVKILGESNSGKTRLLQYLYVQSIEKGFFPLMIEKKDYGNSNIEKMIKGLFEEQYEANSESLYNKYEQKDALKKIIFIDDVDLIKNKKAQERLISEIIESGNLLIYTAKEKELDVERLVKESLQHKSIREFNISPFYKEKRDELISKICMIKKCEERSEAIKTAFDYLVQQQTNFFTFTPPNLIEYIKYFLNNDNEADKGVKTISIVFETNIRNAILKVVGETNMSVYLFALEYIAYKLYFEILRDSISFDEFDRIIKKYNSEKGVEVNAKEFLKACKDANVLKEKEKGFEVEFIDKNTLAYFVARALNRNFENNPQDLKSLNLVMEHICFGINDSIIVFLSFIRSNSKITLNIIDKINEILGEYPEWDFTIDNIPMIKPLEKISSKIPTKSDKTKNIENKEMIESIEKEKQEKLEFQGIFDYSKEDVEKENFRIMRAFKFTQLIGKALPEQYGALELKDTELIRETLFTATQKIIYALFKPLQERYELLVKSIVKFAQENILDEKIDESKVRREIALIMTSMSLGIMNDIAFNALNQNTIKSLRKHENINANHKIMSLMLEENMGNTEAFVEKAVKLYDEYKNDPYARMLIGLITRHHVMRKKDIDYRQLNKIVSAGILTQKGKTQFLIEVGSKKENEEI